MFEETQVLFTSEAPSPELTCARVFNAQYVVLTTEFYQIYDDLKVVAFSRVLTASLSIQLTADLQRFARQTKGRFMKLRQSAPGLAPAVLCLVLGTVAGCSGETDPQAPVLPPVAPGAGAPIVSAPSAQGAVIDPSGVATPSAVPAQGVTGSPAAPSGDPAIGNPGAQVPATPGAPLNNTPPAVGLSAACQAAPEVAPNIPRRLNRAELNNLALDVFGVAGNPFDSLGNDQNSKVAGTSLAASGAFGEKYQVAAAAVAEQYVTASNPTDSCAGAPSADCAVALLQPLAERMMRRPMSPEMQATLANITQVALDNDLSFAEGIQESVTALFLAPDTLYMDTQVNGSGGVVPLDDYGVAERLALAVWNSVPDAELMAAAGAGRLTTDAGLNAEIDRMLSDPAKGERFIQTFVSNFLTFDAITALEEDPPADIDAADWVELVAYMAKESTLFLNDAFVNNTPIDDLMTARHTFLNERLAEHYDMQAEYSAAGGTGDFLKVAIPEGSARIGLATQGYLMSRLSHQPMIFRGKEMRLQFMCATLPGAPMDPAFQALIDEQLMQQGDKTEEELALEREQSPGCAGCHALMDPLGRAFLNFDNAGRVIDKPTNTVYLGVPIENASDAASFISSADGFDACIVGHVLGPVSNRLIATAKNTSDRCLADNVIASVGINPGFRDLLVGTLNSSTFRTRVVGQ